MKRFLISLAALALCCVSSLACGPMGETERYYMFCFCEHTFGENFNKSVGEFWTRYTGNDCSVYLSMDECKEAAQKKGDTEMIAYIANLNNYTEICRQLGDVWEYPTAKQLADRKAQLTRCITTSTKYDTNGRYKERWQLLHMRANMLLKNYQANITYWEQKASQMPEGEMKEMMKNIYANALLNTNRRGAAWNIYAEQNDQQSLLWSVRKYTNLAGIKKLAMENPNAHVLNYLLQTYVNEIQEVFDNYSDNGGDYTYKANSWGEAYAKINPDYITEARNFITFAANFAQTSSTKNPCLWMTAAAAVSYFMDDNSRAKQYIDRAADMNATTPIKDMSRRIRMLIEPSVADINSNSFKSFMANELQWLDNEVNNHPDNYRIKNAQKRIVTQGLANRYEKAGNKHMALALTHLRSQLSYMPYFDSAYKNRIKDNFDYSSDFFSKMKTMNAAEVAEYFAFFDNPDDPLKKYVASKLGNTYTPNYRNDIIGTKLLAENKLADALPYLEKVSQQYLNWQNIGFYAAARSFKDPVWVGLKKVKGEWEDSNGYAFSRSLKGNIKAEFCREVLSLQNQYSVANTDQRTQIAYKLGTYYYQASYKGGCWFITHYAWSTYDEQLPNEANFPEIASKYLLDASNSNDKLTAYNSLFAQAYASPEQLYEAECDQNYNYIYVMNTQSAWYKNLKKLSNLAAGSAQLPEHISRCDYFKKVRTKNNVSHL